MTQFLSDKFYPGISLYLTLGYGPEGEKNQIANQLRENGFKVTDDAIRATMELIRDIYIFVKENCQAEVTQYNELHKPYIYIAGFTPPDLTISKELVASLLGLVKTISLGAAGSLLGAEIHRRLLRKINADKTQTQAEDDRKTLEIIEKVCQKIMDRLVEWLPEYMKQIQIEDKDKPVES